MCLKRGMWAPCPSINHMTINLVERMQSPFGPIYNLPQDEFATFCEYLNENLEKQFIQHSKFPIDAPIFVVKKKNGFFTNVCRLLWT
jgi:hypothetical protein